MKPDHPPWVALPPVPATAREAARYALEVIRALPPSPARAALSHVETTLRDAIDLAQGLDDQRVFALRRQIDVEAALLAIHRQYATLLAAVEESYEQFDEHIAWDALKEIKQTAARAALHEKDPA